MNSEAIIEHGISPTKRGSLSRGVVISITQTLRKMKSGGSFILDDVNDRAKAITAARRLGVTICTEKTDEGLRVYLV